MVTIQYNHLVTYFSDHYRKISSILSTKIQLHSNFRFHIRGELFAWELNDHIFTFFSICLFNWNVNGFLIALLHSENAVVKSFDHLSCTYFELKRRAAFRTIESCTILETSMVMHFNLVAVFCFLHKL